ncbi:hypothetical protein LguiA_021901 [Lonicera macranthoides]
MKSSIIFMKVLLCKIHCPSFICFCKPSVAAAHLYNPGPLKLANTPHVPSTTTTTTTTQLQSSSCDGETIEIKDVISLDGNNNKKDPSTTTTTTTQLQSSSCDGETIEIKDVISLDGDNNKKEEQHEEENALKSCIRKAPSAAPKDDPEKKKRVQWMDNLGKQLVEIKEFESSDTGDNDHKDNNRSCVCTIL